MHHPLHALMKNMLHLVTCHAVNSWSNSFCETRCQIFRHLIKLPVIAKCSSVVIYRDSTRMSYSYRARGPKSLISDEETNCNHCTLQKINQLSYVVFKVGCENCANSDTAEVIGQLTIDEGLLICTGAKYKLDHTGVMHQHLLIAPKRTSIKMID